MDDSIFQSSALTVSEQIRIPNETFFIPESFQAATDEQEVWQKVTGADSVVIADADLDGLGAAAAHFDVFPESVYVSGGPHEGKVSTNTALEIVAEAAQDGVTVTVADIALDSAEDAAALVELADIAGDIYWCDHHPWEADEAIEFVTEHTTRFEHDTAQDETDSDGAFVSANARCGAQITADVLADEYNHTYSEEFRDGIAAIAARDLWRKTTDGAFIHDATEELNAFATSVAWDAASPYSETTFMDFITPFVDHGVDVLSLPSVQRRITAHREKVEAQSEQVFEDFEEIATTDTIELNGIEVETAIVYGRFPTSDVSDEIQRRYGYDLVITLTPTGGMSIRSTEAFPYSNYIAYQFEGGGHPQASGGHITDQFDTILDYTTYWSNSGQSQRERVQGLLEEMTAEQFESE